MQSYWKSEGRNGRRCNKTGNGKTETDGDFFVTVHPKNWKQLKKEEEEELLIVTVADTYGYHSAVFVLTLQNI
jgi:hypothetical protein